MATDSTQTIQAQPFAAALARQAATECSDSPRPLDHRNEAITVCGWWSSLTKTLRLHRNRFGLIRRSTLLEMVNELERRALAHVPAALEAEEARAARLAVVDWIRATIRQQPKRLHFRSALTLNRFFWGYPERTDTYARFFDLRCGLATAAAPLASRRCYVGFLHGAPTLQAMFEGHGRGRRGRGRLPALGIDNRFWAVHEKNRAGHALTRLALAQRPGQPLSLDQAEELMRLAEKAILEMRGGPQFIVSRDGGPRMRLRLRMAREQGASSRAAVEMAGMAALQRRKASAFELINDAVCLEFQPYEPEGDWGTSVRLQWFLDPVAPAARRHSQLFV